MSNQVWPIYKQRLAAKTLEILENKKLNQNILLVLIVITASIMIISGGKSLSVNIFLILIACEFVNFGLSFSPSKGVQEISNFMTALMVVCYFLVTVFCGIFYVIITN